MLRTSWEKCQPRPGCWRKVRDLPASRMITDNWFFSACAVSEMKCSVLLTEEYEAYMKKQEAAMKTEVTAVVPEPKVGDVPPIIATAKEQITSTIISGQVGFSTAIDRSVSLLADKWPPVNTEITFRLVTSHLVSRTSIFLPLSRGSFRRLNSTSCKFHTKRS